MNKSRKTHKNESPLEILKKRYAKGELNSEEYKKKKQDLSAS
jgi:uncharacterized membrane protein